MDDSNASESNNQFRRDLMEQLFGGSSDEDCVMNEDLPTLHHELAEESTSIGNNQFHSDLMEDLFGGLSSDNYVMNEDLPYYETHSFDETNDNDGETRDDFNVEEGPTIGMSFPNVESLFYRYEEYAKFKGFSVAKKSASKDSSGHYKYQTISCDRGRKADAKKSSKRIDCPAKINAILKDGVWSVSQRNDNHNHELNPDMVRLMPNHRNLSIEMRRQLEAYDIAGIRPCKSIRLLEVRNGGPESLGCLPKDCRNFINKRRKLRLGDGDAEAVRKMFSSMQEKDRDFFYSIDTNNEGRLRNLLWIHPRSKAAYEEFHDVVSFDTTYLVNRYRMPFATMVGVNHHGQSILLGCALISHEDVASFKWLFSTWISAMGDIHPNAILTDQCESMKAAIKEVMPNTIQRFCLWHILSKLPDKFKRVREFSKATNEFKSMVYNSQTNQIFETKWNEFVQRYNMENNEWLLKLYGERQSWVPVYLNHIFWAGMVSTQRSESMHAYFDGYVNSRSTLKQFVEQYEIAMTDKIQKEFLADYQSKNVVIFCISDFEWERQFQCSFTNPIFKLVQEQIKRLMYCHLIPQNIEELEVEETHNGVENHKIMERCKTKNGSSIEIEHTVVYREAGQYFNCTCKKFEFKGLLCCHIFKLMSLKNIRSVNERYIPRRWGKGVQRPYTKIFFRGAYPHMTEEYKKFRELEFMFLECTDLSIGSEVKIDLVKKHLESLKSALLNCNDDVTQATCNNEQAAGDCDNYTGTPIRDPFVLNGRGRPRQNRYRGRIESRGIRGSRGGRSIRGGRSGRGGRRGRGGRGTSQTQIENELRDGVDGTQRSQLDSNMRGVELDHNTTVVPSQEFRGPADDDYASWFSL